jgi:hypothetical protein
MSHGSGTGLEILAPRSRLYQGPYGRICPDLPPWCPPTTDAAAVDAYLEQMAARMIEEPDHAGDGDSTIPAGYTYFGQFVDHDITFDPASSLVRRNDPNGTLNFRTPRLDLDCVYGRGPDDQPYLYDQGEPYDRAGATQDHGSARKRLPEKPEKFLIGRVKTCALRDLPRNSQGRALIGDPRNDENAIVSQVHLAFLLAHNALVDRARLRGKANPFEAARQTLRWLYQHIVWNDFIKRVTSAKIHAAALRSVDKGGSREWELGLEHVYTWKKQPFMPVEFSVAAYRFGHSMVRDAYKTNTLHRGRSNPVRLFVAGGAQDADDLRGFRPMTEERVIQWNWFLKMKTDLADESDSPDEFPQKARKIDTKLSPSLASLHGEQGKQNVLAYRNLRKGWTFGLPAGTTVADKFGLARAHLDTDSHDWTKSEPDSLWFYVLREAESDLSESKGSKLGPLGSLIVCATFAGLLKGDPLSYFNVAPTWTPGKDDLLHADDNRDAADDGWTLASIIRIAGLPVGRQGILDQTHGAFPRSS